MEAASLTGSASQHTTPLRWIGERFPTVVLVRDASSYTTAAYIERALATQCNLKTIYVGQPPQLEATLHRLPSRLRKRIQKEFLAKAIHQDPAIETVDLLLVVDPVSLGFVPDGLARRTAFYAIDSHIAYEKHVREGLVTGYDVVFIAQKDHVWMYNDAGCAETVWIPLALDPAIHRKLNLPRTKEVTFVGAPWANTERGTVLRVLGESVGLKTYKAFLHDMVRIYNESKIVFNKSLKGDLNMRVFEALGCGSFLLTDKCGNGLEDLFELKRHCVSYETAEDAVELIKYFLAADDERERIALEGYKHVRLHHTYSHRTADMLRAALGFELTEPDSCILG